MHSTGCRIEFAYGAASTHDTRYVVVFAEIRIPPIEMDPDVRAHSAQRVTAIAADGAPECSYVRVGLDVLLRGSGCRADDITTGTFPPLRLDGSSRSACSWTPYIFIGKMIFNK